MALIWGWFLCRLKKNRVKRSPKISIITGFELILTFIVFRPNKKFIQISKSQFKALGVIKKLRHVKYSMLNLHPSLFGEFVGFCWRKTLYSNQIQGQNSSRSTNRRGNVPSTPLHSSNTPNSTVIIAQRQNK